jgi:phospholipid transport system substrate-binding protein
MKSIMMRAAMVLLLFGLAKSVAAFDAQAARYPVERFQHGLLEVMRAGDSLDFNARRDRLSELLKSQMDIPHIAKLLLGTARDSLSPAQRDELAQVMLKYAVSALAGAFGSYNGQRFEVGAVSQLKSGRGRVRGKFVHADGDVVKLNYLVNLRAQDWRIIDLWFDGVSGLQIYKAEFRSVLSRQSPSVLLNALKKRIRKLEAENS